MTTKEMKSNKPISVVNLYSIYNEMFEEIKKHKWIESEKKGYDVGFETALLDWLKNHKKNFLKNS